MSTEKKLGFGCMRLPLLDKNDPKSIDIEQLCKMVDLYLQSGFSLFDTAYNYHGGYSERALRQAVVDRYPRNAYTVTDKFPSFYTTCSEDYERIFQEQLDRTGLQYFDNYWLHNIGRDTYALTMKYGGFDFLKKLKAEGRAKNIGFSFHDTPELLDEILSTHPYVDFVQLQVNYVDWENELIQSRKCYELCLKHHKPVIVMEPVKGGMLSSLPKPAEALLKSYHPDSSPASWAIRYAASLSNVSIVLSGMSSLEQVADNISYMRNFQPLNQEELDILKQVTSIYHQSVSILCTKCRYCVDVCPQKIDIPTHFALYNMRYSVSQRIHDRMTIGKGNASDCLKCKRCAKMCPQHLPIPALLEKVADAFERNS